MTVGEELAKRGHEMDDLDETELASLGHLLRIYWPELYWATLIPEATDKARLQVAVIEPLQPPK